MLPMPAGKTDIAQGFEHAPAVTSQFLLIAI
jgi:hypothetical protein